MFKGLLITIKIAVMLGLVALAVTSTLYVLDIFSGEAAKQILIKIMSVIGIFTGASAAILITSSIGSKK